MPKTYTSLYPLIINEIDKRTGKSITSIGSRFSVQPGGEGGSLDSRALAEMISTITEDISEIVGAKIISGLDVTATVPASSSINIASGTASSHGKLWELSADTTIKIPLDSTTYVFFVTIYNNTIEITRTHDSTKAELCRIIVPKPGTTLAIVDDKPSNGYDAYIVSAKDIVYKEDQEFDDASIEKLRDVIGDILADNLIGNIKLSENLKIINTQGSLELDSLSLKIKDVDENVLAKFDRNGTFFYDTTGRTLAKFAIDEAYLGNILITKNSIQTRNFSSGALGSGFQILDNGNAEFNNIFLRGKLSASVFEYNATSVIGGNFLISHDADKLNQDMTSSSNDLVTDGDVQFSSGDILWFKDNTNNEYMTISGVTSISNYIVTRSSGGSAVAWKKGTAIVNLGQSGDGGIFMTASESNAPYLNVFTHAGEPWTSITTRLRLGNLNGFLGYTSNLYGIAIGEDTKYLKYDSTNGLRIAGHTLLGSLSISTSGYINSGQTAYDTGAGFFFEYNAGTPRLSIGNSAANKLLWTGTTLSLTGSINLSNNVSTGSAGLYIGADYLGYYSGSAWTSYIANNGTFKFLGSATEYIQWDGSDLTIQGGIISTAASGARVAILPDANTGIIIYDDAAAEVFKALVGGTDVGDVIFGSSNSYLKWDKSVASLSLQSKATSPVSNEKIVLQDNTLKIYDESGNERVILGKIA